MSDFFSGMVKVYDEEFYIDANSGVGVQRLIKKIEPLIYKIAKKMYIPGYTEEEMRQELAILAIEGVRSFSKDRDVKLSTFLHVHLHNKIISKIKSNNKMSNSATSLENNNSLPNYCECGSCDFEVLEINVSTEEILSKKCTKCDKSYSKEIKVAKREYLMCEFTNQNLEKDGASEEYTDILSSISEGIYTKDQDEFGSIELIESINKASRNMDEDTKKMLYMIAFEGYSVTDAANELELSLWSATSKLKSLSRNKKIKEILLKSNE